MLAGADSVGVGTRQSRMRAGTRDKRAHLGIVVPLQVPVEHDGRDAGPPGGFLEVGLGPERSSAVPIVRRGRKLQGPAKRRSLQGQYTPLLAGAIGRHRFERRAESIDTKQRLASRWNHGEAEDAAVRMRRAHEGHRRD